MTGTDWTALAHLFPASPAPRRRKPREWSKRAKALRTRAKALGGYMERDGSRWAYGLGGSELCDATLAEVEDEIESDEMSDRILRALRDGRQATTPELAEEFGRDLSSMRRSLFRLMARGKIERAGTRSTDERGRPVYLWRQTTSAGGAE